MAGVIKLRLVAIIIGMYLATSLILTIRDVDRSGDKGTFIAFPKQLHL